MMTDKKKRAPRLLARGVLFIFILARESSMTFYKRAGVFSLSDGSGSCTVFSTANRGRRFTS